MHELLRSLATSIRMRLTLNTLMESERLDRVKILKNLETGFRPSKTKNIIPGSYSGLTNLNLGRL